VRAIGDLPSFDVAESKNQLDHQRNQAEKHAFVCQPMADNLVMIEARARGQDIGTCSKYVAIAAVLWVGRLFVHIPMPDIAPAAVHQHVASLRTSASGAQDGVRIELP